MTRHTRKWKESQLQEIKEMADRFPVIAIASLKNFPASLFQELRKKLHDKAVIMVSKTRVLKRALGESSKSTEELLKHTGGSVAVIFTELNPFELYGFVKKNKGNVAAKPGMVAPQDIAVPAGDTGLPPGPALSDFKQAGLKTTVKGPTISIAEDSVVAKEGEEISHPVASALSKLDIKPIRVGLSVVAALEEGQLFKAEVLDIDTEKVFGQFAEAHKSALNLSVEAGYFNHASTEILLTKAFRNAKALSLEAKIVNSLTLEELLAKGAAEASALKGSLPSAPKEEKKEEREEGEAGEAGNAQQGKEGNGGKEQGGGNEKEVPAKEEGKVKEKEAKAGGNEKEAPEKEKQAKEKDDS